jgi:hypothetical protein
METRKSKPSDPDLILYKDAQKAVHASRQTLDRLVAKGKLSKVHVDLLRDDGTMCPHSALHKSELFSLFAPRPKPGEPICPPSGGRWYLRDDAKKYSEYSDIVLMPYREGQTKKPPSTRQFYVISERKRGRPKLLTAWSERYLDKRMEGRWGEMPERGRGPWARQKRAKARDDARAFLRDIKRELPIRAQEGLTRGLMAVDSRFVLYDEFRKDDGIETKVIRKGRAGEFWWCRPGQKPGQKPGQSTTVSAVADGPSQNRDKLKETEQEIITAAREVVTKTGQPASAQQIADELHYKNNSYFRTLLAWLVKHDHLRKERGGYRAQ